MDQQQAAATSTTGHPGAAVGLAPGMRFKCEGCGNLTRFDVVVAERVNRFWHVAVSGVGVVEEDATLQQDVESVSCRWCGSADRIVTELAPSAAHDG